MKETPGNKNKQAENGIGPVIGSLIIVIVLIVAALYIWSQHLNTVAQIQEENQNAATTTTTTIIYSTSTEPADIQNDLKASPTIQSPGF